MRRTLSYGLLLLGLVVAGGAAAWYFLRPPPPAPKPPPRGFILPVTLAEVRVRPLEPVVPLTGTVRASARAQVGFLVPGNVASVAVDEGSVVTSGQALATLDAEDQRLRWLAAGAAVDLARKRLDLLLAGSRDEEILRLGARLESARAEAEFTQKEVDRAMPLRAKDAISQRDFDQIVMARDTAVGRRDAAEQDLSEARAGSRPEALEVQRAEIRAREAEQALAEREKDKTTIRAPFGGQVLRRWVSAGDHVVAGAPVFEIVDLDRREVLVEIPAAVVPRLGPAPSIDVTLDGAEGFSLRTRLDAVGAAAEEPSRNFRAIARLDPDEDAARVLKPGLYVRARLHLEPLAEAVVVPHDALRTTPAGTVVVRATKTPPPPPPGAAPAASAGPHGPPPLFAELVPVRVLGMDPEGTAVEGISVTLGAGDRIVVVGAELAFPGAPLLESVAAPAGPVSARAAP